MRLVQALWGWASDRDLLKNAAHELLHWVPAPLAALLNRLVEPLQHLPVLWSPDWHNPGQNPDGLAFWLAVLGWPVLVTIERSRMIGHGGRWTLGSFVAVAVLAVVCIVLHGTFYYMNVQPPWYGILETVWEVVYLTMVVAACFTLNFYLLFLFVPSSAAARQRTDPAAVDDGASNDNATEMARLTRQVSQLDRALTEVQVRLSAVEQNIAVFGQRLLAASRALRPEFRGESREGGVGTPTAAGAGADSGSSPGATRPRTDAETSAS